MQKCLKFVWGGMGRHYSLDLDLPICIYRVQIWGRNLKLSCRARSNCLNFHLIENISQKGAGLWWKITYFIWTLIFCSNPFVPKTPLNETEKLFASFCVLLQIKQNCTFEPQKFEPELNVRSMWTWRPIYINYQGVHTKLNDNLGVINKNPSGNYLPHWPKR